MHIFKVTKKHIFLDDLEIFGCSGFKIIANAGEEPTVVLEIDCKNVIVEDLSIC